MSHKHGEINKMKYILIIFSLMAFSACSTAKKSYDYKAKLMSKSGSQTTGKIKFYKTGADAMYSGKVTGLQPNTSHGFHVHEFGDCSAPDAKSAGGHFNPEGHSHGVPDKGMHHHVGDLKNIVSDANGVAHFKGRALPKRYLNPSSPDYIVGKSIVVHAKADDYKSQPSGNAGARIACGVIR